MYHLFVTSQDVGQDGLQDAFHWVSLAHTKKRFELGRQRGHCLRLNSHAAQCRPDFTEPSPTEQNTRVQYRALADARSWGRPHCLLERCDIGELLPRHSDEL